MSIAYSFSKNNRDGSLGGGRTNSPGPDNYDPDRSIKVVKDSSPEWTFSRSGRPNEGDLNPGPGAYDSDATKLRMNVQYSMGNRSVNMTPQKQDIYQNPGPGSYEPQLLNKPPVFSIAGKRLEQKMSQVPGPGYYDVSSGNSLLNSAKYNASPFGSKSKRDTSQIMSASQRERLMSPGPGAYSPKHEAVKYKNPTFGMQKGQKGISSKDIIPGPGTYDGASKQMGKSLNNISMGSRPQTAKINNTPGPGSYSNHNRTITEAAKSQRGVSSMKNKSERLSSIPKDKVSVPGPGAYDANTNALKDKIKAAAFSKVKRDNYLSKDQKLMPGPGNYNLPNQKSARSFQIGEKINSTLKNYTPGPGNYDPNTNYVKDNTRNVKISLKSNNQQLFHSRSTNQIPGPGQYDAVKGFGQDVPTYSIRGRPKDQRNESSPAPGQYDPSDILSKDRIPQASIKSGSKRMQNFNTSNSNIGPGQYDDKSKNIGSNNKSYSFKPRPKDQLDNKLPGPGAYDADHNIVKDSLRNFKMNNSQRQDVVSKQAKEMPGPGQYTDANQFGKNVNSFTIQSKREALKKDMIPGPGHYDALDQVNRDKSPSYRMGKSARTQVINKEQTLSPGPGNYEENQKFGSKGPQFTMQGKNQPKFKDLSPGPGGYEPNSNIVKDNLRGFQMSKSYRQEIVSKEAKNLPGPGNYGSPQKQGYDGPKYTMGGRSKSRQELSPGPGQYEPVNNLTKNQTVSYAISKSLRSEIVQKYNQDQPGPGSYADSQNQFGKNAQGFSIRGKPDDRIKSDVPGPGQYQADSNFVKDRVVSHKVSQSQRMDIVTKEMLYQPGPGEYDSPKRFGDNAQSVSIRGKPRDPSRNDSPGPGNYETDISMVKDRTLAYKMSSSKRADVVSKEARNLPGPGIYDQHSQLGQNVSYTISGKPKDTIDMNKPGPGQYNPNDNLTKDQALTSFKISQSVRGNIVSKEQLSLPGPGIYDQQKNFGQDAKSFSIRGKPQDKIGNNVPGPGEYDPSLSQAKDAVISYKMNSMVTRTELVSKESVYSPGPGQYESPSKLNTKTFTIGQRNDSPPKNEIPGPGQYNPDETVTKHNNPSFKIDNTTQRTQMVSRDQMYMPGPGNYSEQKQFGQDAQSFSIRGKQQDHIKSDIPGPGQYNPDETVTRHNNPSFKIDNSTQRTQIINKEQLNMPGPGNYADTKQFGQDVKSFSIRGKPQDHNRSDVPGPGQYDAQHDIVKDQARSFRMPQTKRDFLTVDKDLSQPGPGQYDQASQLNSGPSFSIRGRDQDRPNNGIPGPGTYEQDQERIRHQNPSIDFSRSPDRSRTNSPTKDNQPGPGQYDARDYNVSGHTSIVYSIPKGEIRDPVNGTPGPGHYKIPVGFANTPSYSGINQNQEFRYV